MRLDNLSTPFSQKLNQVSQKAIDENRIIGSVVMVAKRGDIIYQQASGYADREQQINMQDDSIFLLSSVTKPIVIAAALLLVTRGQLDLNAAVTDYLSDFTPMLKNGQPAIMTIHQLLTHTAGLSYRFNEPHGQGPYNDLNISDGFDNIYISLAENLHRLSSVPLLYVPGTNWGYSLSIDVLGAVLSTITGQSLETLIDDLITRPLAMNDTGFSLTEPQRLATHYYNATPVPLPMNNDYSMQLSADWNHGIFNYSPTRIFNAHAYHSAGAGIPLEVTSFNHP